MTLFFSMIMPRCVNVLMLPQLQGFRECGMFRNSHTNIGDSERPGGMKSYCSASAKYDSSQGTLPSSFWSNVEFNSGTSSRGARYAQRSCIPYVNPWKANNDEPSLLVTGCIRPETLDRLNPSDGGGQYDSSGGAGGQGNPAGSKCTGYNHYVELVEPDVKRACIRCCDNSADCPLNRGE